MLNSVQIKPEMFNFFLFSIDVGKVVDKKSKCHLCERIVIYQSKMHKVAPALTLLPMRKSMKKRIVMGIIYAYSSVHILYRSFLFK